ncbi:MAG: type II secretion system protein [Candidatus Aminicenantales bacterium]
MKQNGFSLIESLISLAVFSLVVFSALEFFGTTRTLFFKLKSVQETRESAVSAMDKMKIDILKSGQGLLKPISLGLLKGLEIKEDSLVLCRREKTLLLSKDIYSGQVNVHLEDTSGLKPGREVCISDSNKGEIQTIHAVDKESLTLSSPLNFSYLKEESQLLLLERISLYLDAGRNILRRKVNSSSPQPLLEEVDTFHVDYVGTANLAHIRFDLQKSKENFYEMSVFPKNLAFASVR